MNIVISKLKWLRNMERTPQTKTIVCARCKKKIEVPLDYSQKSCPDCLEEMRQTAKRLYQKENELPEDCKIFRANYQDPFIYDNHLPYCSRCKKWLTNKQKAENQNDFWGQERAAQRVLGVSGGEDGRGWRRCCPYCGADLDENPDHQCSGSWY